MLRRTLAGYALHPNFAAVLVICLGCETNQIAGWIEAQALQPSASLQSFTIQESGGTALAVQHGMAAALRAAEGAELIVWDVTALGLPSAGKSPRARQPAAADRGAGRVAGTRPHRCG